jgi:hypothetical protein
MNILTGSLSFLAADGLGEEDAFAAPLGAVSLLLPDEQADSAREKTSSAGTRVLNLLFNVIPPLINLGF